MGYYRRLDINLQGVNLLVNIWDDDGVGNSPDQVDEFNFDFVDMAGSASVTMEIESLRRNTTKSW